jgi:hypothetical protein
VLTEVLIRNEHASPGVTCNNVALEYADASTSKGKVAQWGNVEALFVIPDCYKVFVLLKNVHFSVLDQCFPVLYYTKATGLRRLQQASSDECGYIADHFRWLLWTRFRNIVVVDLEVA